MPRTIRYSKYPSPTDAELLTIAESMRKLGVSRSTLFSYLRTGRLEAVRLSPRKVYIPAAAVARLLLPIDVVSRTAGIWGRSEPKGRDFVRHQRQSAVQLRRLARLRS